MTGGEERQGEAGGPGRADASVGAGADADLTEKPIEIGPAVGDRVGPYRLVRLLGAGATGRVFEVEHTRLGRRAALKTLAAPHAAHPGAARRLFTEALAINRINNAHIVEVTDLVEGGEHEPATRPPPGAAAPAPVNAIVMELLDGRSLARVMSEDGPLEPDRFLPLLAQVCRALAAAHAAGFVHRDLKPDNIFLIDRGRDEDFVKLLDFGLTKAMGAALSLTDVAPSATLDGVFVGTPAYVSPEQASGRAVDPRTDVYAVGVILFELISGRLPFQGPSVGEYLIQHVTAAPPHLPDEVRATRLGAMLDAVVQRCLEKDPAARFPSAARLARMFDDLARGGDIAFSGMDGYRSDRREPVEPSGSDFARATAGIAIGLALALATGVALAHLHGPTRRTSHAASPVAATPMSSAPSPSPFSPAPSAPAQVTFSFHSDPPGAEVRIAGRLGTLGTTPLRWTVEGGPDPIPFELSLAGYDSIRVPTPATSDRTIEVSLIRAPQPKLQPKPRHGPSPETTLDPFR